MHDKSNYLWKDQLIHPKRQIYNLYEVYRVNFIIILYNISDVYLAEI